MAQKPRAAASSRVAGSDTELAPAAIPAQTDEVIKVSDEVIGRRTPEQRRKYQEALNRHRGECVAVDRDDNIVASAASLPELMEIVGARSDVVVFEVEDVPRGQTVILALA